MCIRDSGWAVLADLVFYIFFAPQLAFMMERLMYAVNAQMEAAEAVNKVTLIPALFLLLASKWHNRFFVWIGSYAYSIYLFHGFGTSGGRIILKMMGIDAIVPILLSATFIATIGPVLVDKLLDRSGMLRMLFLGRK